MSLRRKSREFALQMLFQWDMTAKKPALVEAGFWKRQRAEKTTRTFANQLFEGAVADAAAIDDLLKKHSKNWRMDRMAAIDRSILRLGIYELRCGSDTPAKVIINEALELAKKFSNEESGPFINGILDAVHKSIAKDV